MLKQNDVGKPVPKSGLVDNRKTGMGISEIKLPNPARSRVGGVGKGSGVIDGGSLSPRVPKGKKR